MRMGRQTVSANSHNPKVGPPASGGNLGMINQLNQKKQSGKTKSSNNQQIKGIMAAALASV